MMTAARTAPKGKGMDIIEIVLITDDDVRRLSDEMHRLAEETGLKFILRDAVNILHAEAILLLGTAQQNHGLDCGHCGFNACTEKPKTVPCAINSVDIGIAIGSACATAADCRVDTRVMFSAGLAAQRLRILGDCATVMAIPISASSKNPFFDRKTD
jgi:uncharacterized ferredoxin-like protein